MPYWKRPVVWLSEDAGKIAAACMLHIVGGEPGQLRLYAPGMAEAGQDIMLVLRPEDVYGNPASGAVGELELRLDGDPLPVRRRPVPNASKEQAIVIPHHTGHAGNFCDWKDHDADCERLVEIYQARGSYECETAENPLPERRGKGPVPASFVRRALALGWRVGFTAGGDDHMGHSGTDRCHAGLMAVQAEACMREAIWDALWNRRVTATSGPQGKGARVEVSGTERLRGGA